MASFFQWRRVLVIAAVAALCALTATVLIEHPIDTGRTYRIGTRGNTLSAGAAPGRLDVTVISEAARRAGIRLQWIDSPEGPDQALASNRVELWPQLSILPERKHTLHITEPWIISERCLLTKGPPPLSGWNAVSVAYALGPVTLIGAHLPGAQPVYKPNEIAAVQAVCKHEAAAAFVSVHSLAALALRRPAGCETVTFGITPLPGTNLKAGIGSTPETAPVADVLRAQIGRMALDGSLTALFHKHTIYTGSETEVIYEIADAEKRTRMIIYGAACLVLAVAVLVWQMRRVRESRNAAEQANRAKSEFLANMSHEIRTPLNGIAGMVEILAGNDLNADQREMVNVLQQSSESLVSIVNDILDLSNIDAGRMQVEEVPFDVRRAVDSVVKLLSPRANSKGLRFETRFSPEIPRKAKGDPQRLRQVLVNLTANAIKFTETGTIRIEVLPGGDQSEGTAVLFRVVDTGIGIDPRFVNRLFDAFTQADSATTRKYGGTGLGLAISRRLVMLMGGSIGVESTLGEGSTFWFVIPLKRVTETPRENVPLEISATSCPSEPPAKLEIAATPAFRPAAPEPSAKLGHVLIVDDNPINQIVAVRAVHGIGYETSVAGSGEAALNAIAASHFDLILMDCQMPGMDGYQTTAEIRRREQRLDHIPIVAMTANAVEGDQERCAAAGMDDYLTKPLRIATLERTLHRWILQPEFSAAGPNPAAGRGCVTRQRCASHGPAFPIRSGRSSGR